MNPPTRVSVTVTFSDTAAASAGTPATPATCRVIVVFPGTDFVSRVSRRRTGLIGTNRLVAANVVVSGWYGIEPCSNVARLSPGETVTWLEVGQPYDPVGPPRD